MRLDLHPGQLFTMPSGMDYRAAPPGLSDDWLLMPGYFPELLSRLQYDAQKQMIFGPPRVASTIQMRPSKGGKNTAVIVADGVLTKSASYFGTSTKQIREDIRSAVNDPNVSGILLKIDSPGGSAAGTMDMGSEVKAARKKKPVYAFAEDTVASAAYWLASQADMIFANNPTAKIGSIGTYQAVADMSVAAEREGIKVHLFATGPLKGMGTPGVPLTEEQAANLQSLVNETQTHFDTAVRSGRGMSAAQLSAVRSGAVFPATEAIELKLIDGIKTFEQTLEALAAAR